MRPNPVTKPSPGGRCSLHAEIFGAVRDEFVELLERAFVEQQRHAFPRREFAGFVFALAALRAAACFRLGAAAAQLVQGITMFGVCAS